MTLWTLASERPPSKSFVLPAHLPYPSFFPLGIRLSSILWRNAQSRLRSEKKKLEKETKRKRLCLYIFDLTISSNISGHYSAILLSGISVSLTGITVWFLLREWLILFNVLPNLRTSWPTGRLRSLDYLYRYWDDPWKIMTDWLIDW